MHAILRSINYMVYYKYKYKYKNVYLVSFWSTKTIA